MKYGFYFIIAILLLSRPFLADAEQYLCIAEKSAGFHYVESSGNWQGTTFRTDAKYIISKMEGKDSYKVTKVGNKLPLATTEKGFTKTGVIFFEGMVEGEFRFNKNNGRFIYIWALGYYNVSPELNMTDKDSDTPFIEIGKCSPF